jgi:hypothetical protein
MIDRSAREARLLFLQNWIPLGLATVLLLCALRLSDFTFRVEFASIYSAGCAALFAAIAHFAVRRGSTERVAFTFHAMAQLAVLYLVATPLSFIGASAAFPIQDANLAFLDDALALDWRTYFDLVYHRPWLVPYFYLGYALIALPGFLVPVLLGSFGQYLRLQQFTLACILTVFVIVALSTIAPAIGTYQQYGIAPDFDVLRPSGYLVQLELLPGVRDGSLRELASSKMGGIITFPSFHAASAILFLWSLWSIWWLRPFAIIANTGTLLATPIIGGHYFVDVIAGVLVAVGSIMAAKTWQLRVVRWGAAVSEESNVPNAPSSSKSLPPI